MDKEDFNQMLAKYADVIVRVGLNLREGQRLFITNWTARGVTPAGRALVHEVTKAAYAAGAKYVEAVWGDEEMLRIRLQYAPADSFDEFPIYQISTALGMIENGDALLSIHANDPDIYNGLDPERISLMHKHALQHYAPVGAKITRNAVNWCGVASSAPAWAAKIFPDLKADEAQEKLWQAIFETTRVDQPDPVAAWANHIQNLTKRAKYMQACKIHAG